MMKNLFLLPFVLIFSCGLSFAQNSVTVSQKGNGNKATITQGSVDSSEQGVHTRTPCKKEKRKSGPGNSIAVQSNGNTLIDTSGNTQNRYQGVIANENELSAFQYGRGNTLSLLLPDPAGANNLLAAYQNGFGNMLSAILNDSHQKLNVSQSGTGNSVSINPCSSESDTSRGSGGSGKSASVSMQGDGNTVRISQN